MGEFKDYINSRHTKYSYPKSSKSAFGLTDVN